MTESPTQNSSVWPVLCSDHGTSPAVAICTICGRLVCEDCRSLDEHDLAVCSRCVVEPVLSEEFWVNSPQGGFLHNFVQTSKAALLAPTLYARSMRLGGEPFQALKFATLAMIIGKLAFIFWAIALDQETYRQAMEQVSERFDMSVGSFMLLQLVLLPLDALARVALLAFMLQLGVRLAAGAQGLRFSHFVRLVAYISPGYLLLVVPLVVGMFLSFYVIMALASRGLREQLGLSGFQSFMAILPMGIFLVVFDFFGGF